jgi:hypothetical protein
MMAYEHDENPISMAGAVSRRQKHGVRGEVTGFTEPERLSRIFESYVVPAFRRTSRSG